MPTSARDDVGIVPYIPGRRHSAANKEKEMPRRTSLFALQIVVFIKLRRVGDGGHLAALLTLGFDEVLE